MAVHGLAGAWLAMSQTSEAIILELHGRLVRLIAEETGVHYQGLRAAASHLRRGRRVAPALAKALCRLDDTFAVCRHITSISAETLVAQVVSSLRADVPVQTVVGQGAGGPCSEAAHDCCPGSGGPARGDAADDAMKHVIDEGERRDVHAVALPSVIVHAPGDETTLAEKSVAAFGGVPAGALFVQEAGADIGLPESAATPTSCATSPDTAPPKAQAVQLAHVKSDGKQVEKDKEEKQEDHAEDGQELGTVRRKALVPNGAHLSPEEKDARIEKGLALARSLLRESEEG